MKAILAKLSLAVLTGILLSQSIGCETTEGVGRDIEKAGDGIEDAARDAKD
jgi:predicted small secreted protein